MEGFIDNFDNTKLKRQPQIGTIVNIGLPDRPTGLIFLII
jgi:hypothetical protein